MKILLVLMTPVFIYVYLCWQSPHFRKWSGEMFKKLGDRIKDWVSPKRDSK